MSGLVILNATPLTNFAEAKCSNLLFELWPGRVCTTPEVLEEYQAGVLSGRLPPDVWKELSALALNETEIVWAEELPAKLGRGERACISVAYARQGMLVTDDRDARHVARQYDIPLTGSIGILVLSVRRTLISLPEANSFLKRMISSGYHSPVTELNLLIEK